MTLENLLKTGQLKEHKPTREEIRTLLEAVQRNLSDAQVTAISLETRFDAAYKAIMQLSMVALMANGFRTGKDTPGHHMTVIQSLPKSIGLSRERMVVLDALRRKRNASDYMGGYVDQVSMETCIAEAQALHRSIREWLAQHRPALLE